MPFEDEIMILEGFEDAVNSVATVGDVFAALTDFPPGVGDSLISGCRKDEDTLDDVVGDLGRRPRRPRRPGPRPRPRPRPRPPFPRRPFFRPFIHHPPTVIVREDPDAVSSTTAANRRRILMMERKMKELHPKKVTITSTGVEGLGVPVMMSGLMTQLGAIRRAAAKPNSPDAKVIVKNLVAKGRSLANLAARRRGLAMNALRGYKKEKKTVDKLERVSKSKSMNVLKTALATKGKTTSPAIDSKMNREIKDSRRLRNRAVMAGRRAIQDMKLNSVASLLAGNAESQARAAVMTAKAISEGNLSNARAFSAVMVKNSQRARQLKAVRRKQMKLWSGKNKRMKMLRLDGRRMRAMKAIAALQRKDQDSGLTVADKAMMKSAYDVIRGVETTMIGMTGGSGIQKQARKALALNGLEAMTVKDMEPVFSAKMAALPSQGEWLTGFGATVIPAVDKRMRKKLALPSDPSGRFLEEGFVAPSELGPVKFAVDMKPNDPSGQFLIGALGDLSGNLVEDTSFMSLKLKAPSWSTVKKIPSGVLKRAEEALPMVSKRVGNTLKQRARALWNFSHVRGGIRRAGRNVKMIEESKNADKFLRIGQKQRHRMNSAKQKRDLERFKKRYGKLPGLGDLDASLGMSKARVRYIKKFLRTTVKNRRAIVQKLKKHPAKLKSLKRDVRLYKEAKKLRTIPETIWMAKRQALGAFNPEYEPFSIPEAIWQDKKQGLGDFNIPEAIMVEKGTVRKPDFIDYRPFSIPEAIWTTRGFGELLL